MYCSQAFGEAATIDNFGAHPFMAQFGPLPASAAGPAAPGAAAEGPSSTVAAALNSRSSAPAAVPAPVSAVKPAEPVAAPASSFDLLSMDDESPVRLLSWLADGCLISQARLGCSNLCTGPEETCRASLPQESLCLKRPAAS